MSNEFEQLELLALELERPNPGETVYFVGNTDENGDPAVSKATVVAAEDDGVCLEVWKDFHTRPDEDDPATIESVFNVLRNDEALAAVYDKPDELGFLTDEEYIDMLLTEDTSAHDQILAAVKNKSNDLPFLQRYQLSLEEMNQIAKIYSLWEVADHDPDINALVGFQPELDLFRSDTLRPETGYGAKAGVFFDRTMTGFVEDVSLSDNTEVDQSRGFVVRNNMEDSQNGVRVSVQFQVRDDAPKYAMYVEGIENGGVVDVSKYEIDEGGHMVRTDWVHESDISEYEPGNTSGLHEDGIMSLQTNQRKQTNTRLVMHNSLELGLDQAKEEVCAALSYFTENPQIIPEPRSDGLEDGYKVQPLGGVTVKAIPLIMPRFSEN